MTYTIFLYIMVLFYIAAGINHFKNPGFYLGIIPRWLPNHKAINYLSGICEIIFALLLLFPVTRSAGAWLIILLLIAVFPANIQMSLDFYKKRSRYYRLSVLRLPLQVLFIWWAYLYT